MIGKLLGQLLGLLRLLPRLTPLIPESSSGLKSIGLFDSGFYDGVGGSLVGFNFGCLGGENKCVAHVVSIAFHAILS